MQIPVDDNGLEWWEKLPIEKQDRFPLPPPTPESIEDIHWQLIVELDEKSLEAAVKDSGKLPGDHCSCKACTVHKRNFPGSASCTSRRTVSICSLTGAAVSSMHARELALEMQNF